MALNKIKNRNKMGCDYYVYTEYVIEYVDSKKNNDYEKTNICISQESSYFGDYFDSDNETYEQYRRRTLREHSDTKVIYTIETGWQIKNTQKYIDFLKTIDENIDNITSIKKLTYASERD